MCPVPPKFVTHFEPYGRFSPPPERNFSFLSKCSQASLFARFQWMYAKSFLAGIFSLLQDKPFLSICLTPLLYITGCGLSRGVPPLRFLQEGFVGAMKDSPLFPLFLSTVFSLSVDSLLKLFPRQDRQFVREGDRTRGLSPHFPPL